MTRALVERLGGPRRAAAVAGTAALGVAALCLSGGSLGPVAARCALAVAALGALAVLARRGPRAAPMCPIQVLARSSLGRDAGLVLVETAGRRLLVETAGRRLLVGHGDGGVRLVADLGAVQGGQP